MLNIVLNFILCICFAYFFFLLVYFVSLHFVLSAKTNIFKTNIFQGDLGGIDKKYDIAISTACGALDNMVVDKMDTAQRGVEFLKKNNVGSTTFVALDKVRTSFFLFFLQLLYP